MLPVKYQPQYTVTFAPNLFHGETYQAQIPVAVPLQALFGECDSYEGFYVEVDGEFVDLSADLISLKDSQIVTIKQIPQDGDILRSVLQIIAIIVIAYFAGPAGLALEGWQYAAFVAVASVASQLAINTLIPFELPEPVDRSGKQLDNLSPSRNRVDQYEPITQLFGRIKHTPAYAALPYTELVGNDQYMNALFLVGHGDICEPENIRIGNTKVEDFDGFEISYVNAADVVFPVIYEENLTLDLNQLDTPGDVQTRVTAPDTQYIGIDIFFPRGLVRTNNEGDRLIVAADFKVEVRLVGTSTWKQIKSGENDINHWADYTYGGNTVDFFLDGLATYLRKRKTYRPRVADSITRDWEDDDLSGNPVYGDLFRIAGKSYDTIRRGLKFLPPDGIGQYEVRVTRARTSNPTYHPSQSISEAFYGEADWSTYFATDAKWVSLRSYKTGQNIVPVNKTPGDTEIVYAVLRIRATDQLTGALDLFSHIIQRTYRYWDGSAWVFDTTVKETQVYPRSPAWAAVEVLTGSMNPRPVAFEKIDANAFKAWADWCKMNGFYYDEEIYGAQSVWDVVKGIAAAGRAEVVVRDGLYTVIQDNGMAAPVQMFTPRNSKGFKGTKTFIEEIHAVKVTYRSESEDYEQTEQIVYNDGYTKSNASKFETITLNGVTNDRQAWREGRRYIAIAIHRPEFFEIQTDVEHIASTRGDTVLLQHEAALIGQVSLRAVGVSPFGAYSRITLDGEVLLEVGKTYSLQFRYRVGNTIAVSTYTVQSQVSSNVLLTTTRVDAGIAAGTLVAFGEQNLVTLRCKVLSIQPRKDFSATITLIPEGAPIYTADTGAIPPYDPVITQPPDFTKITPDPPIIIAVTSGNWSSPQQPDGSIFLRLMVTYLVNHLQNFEGIEVQGRIRESAIGLPVQTVVSDWRTSEWSNHDGGSMWFDHVQSGVAYDVQIRVRSLPYFLTSGWSDQTTHIVGTINHAPPVIDGMIITPMVGGVHVEIDLSSVLLRDAQYVEVIYSTIDDRDDPDALRYVHNIPANIMDMDKVFFSVPLTDGQLYYFWARIVNKFGVPGVWFPEDVIESEDFRVTSTDDDRVTSDDDERVLSGVSVATSGITGFALQDLVWYILPKNGTAIKNGTGTLRIEAHKFTVAGDSILSAGTIKMYKPDGTTLAGDGYVWDGIAAADITGSIVITLKDSVSGKVYDTVTLTDITDGATVPDLSLGYMDGYDKMLWRRDRDNGSWQPNTGDIHVDVTFIQGTTVKAKSALNLSLNTSTGAITASASTHTAGNLDAVNVTWKINGATRTLPYANGTVVTLQASYVINGQTIIAVETFYSVEGGSAGSAGPPGASGSLTVSIKRNYKTFSTTRNNNLYVHGFDNTGTAVDGNGTMVHNGQQVTIGKGTLLAKQESLRDGWILFDTAGGNAFTDNGSGSYGGVANYNLALVKRFRDGWKYDDITNDTWTPFSLTADMVIFGSYTKDQHGDSVGSITAVTTFGNGVVPASIPVEQAEVVKPGDISANAITSVAQFASSLSPIGIVASIASVTGGTWAGPQTVFATDTRKIYRLVSNTPAVWTAQIVAYEDLVANSIRAGQIEAGAIGTTQLAAEAVKASRIAVLTQGPALNINPMMDDLDAWYAGSNEAQRLSALPSNYVVQSVANNVGLTALRVKDTAPNQDHWFFSRQMFVDPKKTYRVSCWARRANVGDSVSYLLVNFKDGSGNNIQGNLGGATGWLSLGTFHYWGIANSQLPLNTWTRYEFVFGFNADASFPATTPRTMQIGAIATYAGSTVATICDFQDFRCEEVLPGTLIQDGSIITDKLAANAVTAEKIAADTITAREIKARTLSVDKFQIGGINLVNDPGFEYGGDSWNLTFGTNVVSTSPHSGTKCCALSSGSLVTIKSALIPVEEGDDLIYQMWMKTVGTIGPLGYIGVDELDAIGAVIDSETVALVTATAAWTKKTATKRIPAGIKFVQFVVYAHQTGSGTLYVDDFRVLNAINSGLLVDGEVTAEKLEASLILSSEIHTANPLLTDVLRVSLDDSDIPFFIGKNAKTLGNALMMLDAANEQLYLSATLVASKLKPSVDGAISVETTPGIYAPLIGIQSNSQYDSDATSAVNTTFVQALGGSVNVIHPTDTVYTTRDWRRLQEIQQPFLVEWDVDLSNRDNSSDATFRFQIQYNYDSGADVLLGSESADITIKAGRSRHFMLSRWFKPKASGWAKDLTLFLLIKRTGSISIDQIGGRTRLTIPNIGDLNGVSTTTVT